MRTKRRSWLGALLLAGALALPLAAPVPAAAISIHPSVPDSLLFNASTRCPNTSARICMVSREAAPPPVTAMVFIRVPSF